jgi:hypothetical protein
VIGLRRHPLIDPIFPRSPGVNLLPPGGTSTSSSRLGGIQPLSLQLFNCHSTCTYHLIVHTIHPSVKRSPSGPCFRMDGIKKPRACRVLQSSEPAEAGRGPTWQFPPWPRPIASSPRDWTPLHGCWLRTGVQHREHSRAPFLYHKPNPVDRERLIAQGYATDRHA